MHPLELEKPASPWRIRLIRAVIILGALAAAVLALLGSPWLSQLIWPDNHSDQSQVFAQQSSTTPTTLQPTATETLASTSTPTPFAPNPFEADGGASLDGLIVVSLSELGYSQLFHHQLLGQPFTRLTQGTWDDIDPSLSPDGEQIAFASNRSGSWDLYLLDLSSGETIQLSDDPEYDGHPSWSSDGAWLAYEHDNDGNLDIFIRPINESVEPVNVSASSAIDLSPAWRPDSQQIAFISNRGGRNQIWLVYLDREGDDRFRLLVESPNQQASPAWAPNMDDALSWAQQDDGQWFIYQQLIDSESRLLRLGLGTNPQWNPSGNAVLAEIRVPNETYLTAYSESGGLALAPELLPGHLEGFSWSAGALPDPLPTPINAAAQVTPSGELLDALSSAVGEYFGKNSLTDLADLNAPFEQIHESVLTPFEQLRIRASQLLGWDALSELQNTYVPLDEPLPPDRQQDWLYTGRAFELHSGLLNADWMAIVREDFDGQTYWRVYLRTANEIGGFGQPLTEQPWDLSARYSGTESDYIDGGEPAENSSPGYWVDFTALASDFGFERVPALGNWRSYYQGALFNLFVLRAGLTWEEAMLQLYSREELATIVP